MFGIPGAAAFALVRKPARYALALAAILLAGALDTGYYGETLYKDRNFFGVIRVTRDGSFHKLFHGTTMHGQQRTDEPGPPRPMTYYSRTGPVGQLFDSLPPPRVKRVAVVGLGTGAVASYAKRGQEWTFYEIDPAVVRIARDTSYFRFLAECPGACEVVLGDARRHLARVPDCTYDVIILDGFCSDAIPVHLLTREAIGLYVSKLAPGGVIALHVSNSHLDLPPLLKRALRYVPVAVMTALWAPELLLQDGVVSLSAGNERLLGGALAVAVAWQFRVTFVTILAGLLGLHLFDWMF